LQVVAEVEVQVAPPGVAVTVYRVIEAPPSAAATQDTVDSVDSNELATTPVGAVGTVDGVAEFERADAGPVPAGFAAVMVNRYAMPLVRPVTVHVVVLVVHVASLGDAVTVYVTARPPLLDGAVQDTTEDAFALEVAETSVGAPGIAAGVAAAEAVEATEVPIEFVAVTLNV
jgi:hypothetical protein